MALTQTEPRPRAEEGIGNRVVDLIASEAANYSPNFVFGVPGDKIDPVIDGFTRQGFRFILAHDEGNSAFMASVAARLTGKLGVCMGMGAPGAAKLIPGLLQAYSDRVPVLAISGQVESYNYGTDFAQEANLMDIFNGACVYNQMITTPKNAGLLARIACRTAFAKRGVSHLSVPVDVATQIGERDNSEEGEMNVILAPPSPRPELIEEAAKLLNGSGNVIIIAGRGAANCADFLSKIGEKLQAPIFTTYSSRDVLPANEPHNLGVAWWSSSVVRKVMQDADVLLLVGTDYPYMKHVFSPTTKVIQIDSNQYNLGKRVCTVPILGDARESLSALLSQVQSKTGVGYFAKAQGIMSELLSKVDIERNDTTRKPINTYYAIKMLEDSIPEDSVITLDGGMIGMYMMSGFNIKKHICVQGGRYASLGFSVPAAIGSKLVYPEREVIAATGDFGMMYCVQEIITAVQNKLPIKIIVFNNRTQLTVTQTIKNKHFILPADPGEVDFAKAAEAFGATGRRVDDPKDLKRGIDDLLSIKGVGLLDVRTTQEILPVQHRTRPH
jgi:pyruvate dehydrogenase (quinone)